MIVKYLDKNKDWQEQNFHVRPGPSVCVQRFGAFGDMLQMSSVLPLLKEQGFYVCVNTTPAGYLIIRNDPHIDEVFIQDEDQVKNQDLGEYWFKLSKVFTKFVILSESVEGSLLALEGRKQFYWQKDFRHLLLNINYLLGTHVIAGVEYKPQPKFYPSSSEKKWAADYRKKLGLKNKVVMWSIAGSAVHKVYPHMDVVMARMLHLHSDIRFVLVGDGVCQIAEMVWHKEPRVILKSGKWKIREALSFAKECDLVVGPETGVMNAVSFENNHKILFLSHSSKENIGGDWINTDVLEPENCHCYPCHQLHKSFKTCTRDDNTGVSLCAANISADSVFDKMQQRLGYVNIP